VKLYSFTCLQTGEMPSSLQLVSRLLMVRFLFFIVVSLTVSKMLIKSYVCNITQKNGFRKGYFEKNRYFF